MLSSQTYFRRALIEVQKLLLLDDTVLLLLPRRWVKVTDLRALEAKSHKLGTVLA